MSINDVSTIASDSFGINLQGTFRTASFGGENLEASVNNDISADIGMKPDVF